MREDIRRFDFFKKLTACPFVQEIWLFGSRLRKDHQERSDIDLAVFCPSVAAGDWLHLLEIVEEADTLFKIDCIRLDELLGKNPLKESIRKQGIKIYSRDPS